MKTAHQKQKRLRRGAPWTAREIKSLGKKPDSVLARRMGRTISEVVAERENRGIGVATGPRRWTAREIKLLGRFDAVHAALGQNEAEALILGEGPQNFAGAVFTVEELVDRVLSR